MRLQAKLFEAMASGTPVVVAVQGLMHKILTESNSGVTVSPGDVDHMIQAIDRLLNDDSYYQTISKNARQYAETNYSLEHHVDNYEAILHEITER